MCLPKNQNRRGRERTEKMKNAWTLEKVVMLWGDADEGRRRAAAEALLGANQNQPDKVIRHGEAARRLGCTVRTVNSLIRSGALSPVRLPGRTRAVGVRERELAAMISGKEVRA